MQVFRRAKSFFDQQNIELVGGLSLVKSEESSSNQRSLNDNTIEVESARSVEARENALESFLSTSARDFIEQRSLNWNFIGAARSLANAIPEDLKTDIREAVVEGRGKKKILKKILPLLGLVKLKVAGLAILLLFGIGFLAKKAIFISLISIAISLFLAVKKLLGGAGGGLGGKGGVEHVEAVPYHGGGGWSSGGGGSAGWSSGGYGGGADVHGGYDYGQHSQPIGQTLAYSGHHKVARR